MINAVKEDPAGCCEASCRPERRGALVTPTPEAYAQRVGDMVQAEGLAQGRPWRAWRAERQRARAGKRGPGGH